MMSREPARPLLTGFYRWRSNFPVAPSVSPAADFIPSSGFSPQSSLLKSPQSPIIQSGSSLSGLSWHCCVWRVPVRSSVECPLIRIHDVLDLDDAFLARTPQSAVSSIHHVKSIWCQFVPSLVMQSLVTWCSGLSVHVFPPKFIHCNPDLHGDRIGGGPLGGNRSHALQETWGSSPALSLPSKDSWETHAVHQVWERLSPGADPAALIPRKSVSLMSSQSTGLCHGRLTSWLSGIYEVFHCQTVLFALATNKHFYEATQ